MTRKSFVTNAQDTIVDGAKTSAEGVKILAGEAAKAAAVAATGVIVEGVKYALNRGQNKVATKAARQKTKKPAKKKAVTKKKPVVKKSARKAVKKKRTYSGFSADRRA